MLFLALYLPVTIQVARLRPLWEDEMFTLALARIDSPGELWSALLTGADQHPFLFYRLSGLLLGTLRSEELALRWPAVIAGVIVALAVFAYVSPRTSPLYGLVGMLLVSTTAAWTYASEARGYELMTAAIAVALVAWQAVGRRRGAAVALALAALAAVCSHYFAVIALAAFASGELLFEARSRTIRWSVWAALASAGLMLFLCFPIIRAASTYAPTFWGKPSVAAILDTYTFLFVPPFVPILIAVVIGCVAILLGRPDCVPAFRSTGLPPHEMVAVGALTTLPVVAVIVTSVFVPAYAPRYVLPTVIGSSILLSLGLHRACRWQANAGTLLVLLLSGWFVYSASRSITEAVAAATRIRDTGLLLAGTRPDLPLVGYNPEAFLTMAVYGPPQLRHRVHYLADSAESLRYLGQNTADRGLPALSPWFPPGIEPFRPFVSTHRRFIVYGWPSGGARTWLLRALIDERARLAVVGRSRDLEVFDVDLH